MSKHYQKMREKQEKGVKVHNPPTLSLQGHSGLTISCLRFYFLPVSPHHRTVKSYCYKPQGIARFLAVYLQSALYQAFLKLLNCMCHLFLCLDPDAHRNHIFTWEPRILCFINQHFLLNEVVRLLLSGKLSICYANYIE